MNYEQFTQLQNTLCMLCNWQDSTIHPVDDPAQLMEDYRAGTLDQATRKRVEDCLVLEQGIKAINAIQKHFRK